ncbi:MULTISPECIES: PepSY domain-containing protein [unclassified Streptomyces]|uniref:PepSY domain-containing protein n=1 Tax=unclassified Streptomyces TaxID=2593676 RepID=UPI0020306216|nr:MULTISPECIES: PepSY domain-containing protein [unclassified Streptomyces]MCM1971215.1 PepSY domain-containing protein [Streptomyces sp. G1]MCX5122435.1 PepSY domain-containing protein [Streptomyces sp. NBC_00347]MCX5295781.1 PepSY domain-containing protein [Streptomyces sp. NBC_00193]
MKRTLYVSSAAAAAVLLVAGPVAAAAASTAGAATGSLSAPLRAAVDAEGAAAAALKSHPGVIESLDKDGPVWHVNVIGKDGSNTELLVTAATGAVTVENSDENDDDGDEDAALVAAKVTAQQAMKAAVAAHPGQVWSVQWDDDDDNNTTYWDVEVKSGGTTTNVHVDPTSGKATVSQSDNGNDNDENDSNDDNG